MFATVPAGWRGPSQVHLQGALCFEPPTSQFDCWTSEALDPQGTLTNICGTLQLAQGGNRTWSHPSFSSRQCIGTRQGKWPSQTVCSLHEPSLTIWTAVHNSQNIHDLRSSPLQYMFAKQCPLKKQLHLESNTDTIHDRKHALAAARQYTQHKRRSPHSQTALIATQSSQHKQAHASHSNPRPARHQC